jgi:rRNA maturation RNase YbeY
VNVECHQIADTYPVSAARISELIAPIISKEKPNLDGEIRIILVDDTYMLHLNQKYLNHDYATDVLSFELDSKSDFLDGEVYISLERAVEQAEEYRVAPEQEIWRLAIHGTLHLLGYDDQTENGRRAMHEKEDAYLHSFALSRKEL